MTSHVPSPTWRLAPGVRVVARGRDRLQIGLYGEGRLVVRRSAPVDRLLDDLVVGRSISPENPVATALLESLHRAGLVLAADGLARARAARAGTRVHVVGSITADPTLADALDDMLDRGGLLRSATADSADVVMVVTVGETRRELLDPLVRSDLDHLVVRLVDGGAVLGPFVTPGRTPCLRCIDAHCCVEDPDHVAVIARYVLATEKCRADGVPDFPDPLLTTQALAAAVRDVVAHVEGREPATRSHTVRLGPEATDRSVTRWAMHPRCGCSLVGDLGLSGTMGA
jgi:hypothetical protein